MGTTESSLAAPPPPSRRSPHYALPLQTQTPFGSRPRPIRRPRPGPVVTLNGLVLGLTGSGKRTLLQRLEGKDPFASVAITDGSSNSEQHQDEESPRGITVPYQPPQDATVWDRIQLHVERTPNKDVAVDFAVILINPRHDAKSLQPYISRLVSMLLIQQRERNKPLCLCFLLNFRDLQGDRYPRIPSDTVEKWARDEIVKQHKVNENLVILQCTSTSLKNCYGLSSLHHFIYRSYLVHKEMELEQRLSEVQSLLKDSQEVPSTTYEAFLKVVAQTSKKSFDDQQDSSTGESSHGQMQEGRDQDWRKKNSNDEKRHEATDRTRQQSSTDNRRKQTQNEPESLRSILPKTYGDPTTSLDAFFADDDDDEEKDIVTPVTSHHARDRILHSSDSDEDDDEDDDFFYDEGGHRHQHGTVVMDSLSDQEDEGSVESFDSQIAHARDHSILDSEESSVNELEEIDVDVGATVPVANDEQTRNTAIAGTRSDDGSKKEEVVKDGWDNNDDIEGDVDSDKEGEVTDYKDEENGDRLQTPHQTTESDEDDVTGNGEGWGDDNDIDLNDDAVPDTQPPLSYEENVSTDGTNATSEETREETLDKEQVANGGKNKLPSIQPEPSPDEEVEEVPTKQQDSPSFEPTTPDITPKDIASKVDNPAYPSSVPVAKKPPSQAEQDESSDDDDDFIVEETVRSSSPTIKEEAHIKTSIDDTPELSVGAKKPASCRPIAQHDDESDDNDDFVVETAAPSSTSLPTRHAIQPVSVPEIKSLHPSSSSTGISAAALAAIAAAEKEAARMMQDTGSTPKEAPFIPRLKSEKKKSKKNKDPDAKKKKKKHKESSSSSKRSTKESL